MGTQLNINPFRMRYEDRQAEIDSLRRGMITPQLAAAGYWLTQGLKNKQIAVKMNLSEGTVKIYISRLYRKLNVRDDREFIAKYYLGELSDDAGRITAAGTKLPKQ